ncbi:hypothetical protein CANCADRAFT_116001 [Tortispora caseinolytica NRRL Y-17796]|uniref:Arginase n=1 Tax=Tortispora caseinolytica NRRL Y-17796 TaxID=767744 RepID=A0A1E4TH23_9ASCO|nr:hypothetical protein CANCADRAFT_116001 [Tortispora caseinolytica NRRL Y-17796]
MSYAENFLVKPKFIKNKEITVIAAPFSGGQPRGGVEDGPDHLLKAGLLNQVRNLGWKTVGGSTDTGLTVMSFTKPPNDTDVGKMKQPRYVSNATQTLYKETAKVSKSGALSLLIGGDHSLAIGSVSGVFEAHPDACLLWIDAHADLNTPETTESGNLHGCPVSFLLGLAKSAEMEDSVFRWVKPCLATGRLAYIGLRDLDAGERAFIREYNIAAYTMHHVDKFGIGRVVEMALDRINPDKARPIHLSFDVDALDPIYTPATGTPVRGGLTLREGCYICEAVAETGALVGMDLVETNPALGSTDQAIQETVSAGLSLVRCALGETLL